MNEPNTTEAWIQGMNKQVDTELENAKTADTRC
jgi:hypothetical protein